ncbi:DUF726 domain protein [Pleurostoma richardsiae]|uniref:DUF726 domain protein n=1 Tax=Pleurostoma richardsiae TaxID=41990 RepID=A0AA38RMH8_9PEZI|nr:DUF726 domain protein [Pleurostoma richardsiae]
MASNEEAPGDLPPSPESKEKPKDRLSARPANEPISRSTTAPPMNSLTPELDDFGLPLRTAPAVRYDGSSSAGGSLVTETVSQRVNAVRTSSSRTGGKNIAGKPDSRTRSSSQKQSGTDSGGEDGFRRTVFTSPSEAAAGQTATVEDDGPKTPVPPKVKAETADTDDRGNNAASTVPNEGLPPAESEAAAEPELTAVLSSSVETAGKKGKNNSVGEPNKVGPQTGHSRETSLASTADVNGLSEFSHQRLTAGKEKKEEDDEAGWQTMPAYAPYDIYDDDNKLIAREHDEAQDEKYGYSGLGGAGKGYTRVLLDDDAESVTSMDDNTQYLFKEAQGTSMLDDEQQRDAVSQLQATKDLLTEGQRIAYVGLTRLELSDMAKEVESIEITRSTKKQVTLAAEALKMWSQKMMIRLYTHMDISAAEQVMIEQLSEHGVMPGDLTPLLMQNARVKNPMAQGSRNSTSFPVEGSPQSLTLQSPSNEEAAGEAPPPYEAQEGGELPGVRTPSQLPNTAKIDIDLRWTVLCDLFLVLISDSIYDARSRVLLERVGKSLQISSLDICRFEKKVTDALEMQQQAEKENWNEEQHMENRRKMALKRRYVMMGLATVGGGLVIGLSAGLLAPMIGAGLAAGFTTIGVTGTSSFLAGAGGAAIITSGAAASGSVIGVRAANRRTGAVKTFEYRPLHNNKRVNLIVTISGWMTGKVDDVRLPYSTVDPIMGDIYSVLWEPEMLTSMGDTINILATEALTQGLQQLLGSTILVSLMAALQLPVVLTKLSYLIDNPWAVSLDRAWAAGLILADSLVDRNLGTRPVTLVGYSLGSRVIFSCLLELARKGAFGLIQNVYMFGSPVVVKRDEWARARTIVSGRMLNGYNRNDWILGYLFRLTNGGIRRIAGLAPVEGIPGMENMDVTEHVVGHMDYRTAMPRLLRECGWLVESDEFTEIEDPDPENHAQRQRELINEIEEARKELEKEKEPKGGLGGFFNRKKKGRKQEWEVYEESGNQPKSRTEDSEGNNHGVLFDVDAIRAELAKEQLEVKELQSTLPPMKIPSPNASPALASPPSVNPRSSLRETKSTDGVTLHPSQEYAMSEERTPTFPKKAPPESYASLQNSSHDDEGIRMTFDTAYEGEIHSPMPLAKEFSEPSLAAEPPARPEMKTSQTLPNVTIADPWADLDDEDFGKEKEISLTFA